MCVVAPFWMETGRYENKTVNERVCFVWNDKIEDKKHVILDCSLYADLRESLIYEIKRNNGDFDILSNDDNFIYLFKSTDCFYVVAKTCLNILSRWNRFLYAWLIVMFYRHD